MTESLAKQNIIIRALIWLGECNAYQIAGLAILATIPVAAFFSLDFLGAPRKMVDGTILGEHQTWGMKHSYRCYVKIRTTYGILSDVYLDECKGYWHPGEKVTLQIILGRITGPEVYGESMKRAPY